MACLFHMWFDAIQELLGNHPISDVLWSLCGVTMEADKHLRHHTSNINLKQDTKQLRFYHSTPLTLLTLCFTFRFHCQRNSGELKDLSSQTSLLHTIRTHVKVSSDLLCKQSLWFSLGGTDWSCEPFKECWTIPDCCKEFAATERSSVTTSWWTAWEALSKFSALAAAHQVCHSTLFTNQ